MNARSHWQRLSEAGLVSGMPDERGIPHGPWYIAAMLGAAAWLAALFLLVFLGLALADLVKKPAGALATGLVVCALAVLALRRAGEHPFAGQLALAFSLAGQALVLVGLAMEAGWRAPWGWFVFAGFEAVLVAVVAHAAHRVLATFACATAVLVALSALSASSLYMPLVLAGFVAAQARVLAVQPPAALWHSLSIGLALAVVAAMVHAAFPELWTSRAFTLPLHPVALRWIAVLVLALVSAWAGVVIVRDVTGTSRSTAAALAACALAGLAIAAFPLPGVAAATVMLLLAFGTGQTVLSGLAVLALIGSLAHYYYALETTLLAKAGGLLAMGMLLLSARFVVRKLMPPADEASHA